MDTLYQLTRALPIIQLSVRFKYRRKAFVKIGFDEMIKVDFKKISSRDAPCILFQWDIVETFSNHF